MLEADSHASMVHAGAFSLPSGWAEPMAQSTPRAEPAHVVAGRYGEGRTSRWPAILIAIAVHLLLGAALTSLGYRVVHHRAESLVAVNLAPPPPPNPSEPAPPESQTLQTSVQTASVTVPAPVTRAVVAAIAAPRFP